MSMSLCHYWNHTPRVRHQVWETGSQIFEVSSKTVGSPFYSNISLSIARFSCAETWPTVTVCLRLEKRSDGTPGVQPIPILCNFCISIYYFWQGQWFGISFPTMHMHIFIHPSIGLTAMWQACVNASQNKIDDVFIFCSSVRADDVLSGMQKSKDI